MDAQTYADHAGRGGKVEKEDVDLAVQARAGWEFDEAPPRDVRALISYPDCANSTKYLASLAVDLNSIPLPPITESFETVRLPPPADRLTSVAFDIIPNAPPRPDPVEDSESEGGSELGDADAEMADGDEGGGQSNEDVEGQPQEKAETREVDEDYDD
jgi:transcription initiation factor TFIID subunit 9B